MASTFTGLKLQGSIGKFGKIELSDIQAFVELPDGKVRSLEFISSTTSFLQLGELIFCATNKRPKKSPTL